VVASGEIRAGCLVRCNPKARVRRGHTLNGFKHWGRARVLSVDLKHGMVEVLPLGGHKVTETMKMTDVRFWREGTVSREQ
jgi:hypothetical protein